MVTVTTHRYFEKEIRKIPKNVIKKIDDLVNNLAQCGSIDDVLKYDNIEPLVNSYGYYRIRFGKYRCGIEIKREENTVILYHIGTRGDFYKYFPPKNK